MHIKRAGGLALLVIISLGVGVFDHELWPPTEQAMAGVTWELYRGADPTVPTIDGLPYLEKPPLAYVFSWLAFEGAGHPSAGLLRLPAALAGLACLLLVLATAWRLYDEATAWTCALICALTFNFFGIMHRASTDSIAVFFAFLAFAIFLSTLPGDDAMRPEAQSGSILYRDVALTLVLAISFLVKNFYVYFIVLPSVAAYLLWASQRLRCARLALLATASFLVIVLPWAYALYSRGGADYLRVVFFDNTVGRLTNIGPPDGSHLPVLDDAFVVHKNESLWTGLRALTEEMLPWLPLYAAVLATTLPRPRKTSVRTFLLMAIGIVPLALTLSAARVESYYRPAIFLLVLLAGDFVRELYAGRAPRWAQLTVASNFWILAVLLALLPLGIGYQLRAAAIAWLGLPFALWLTFLVWRHKGPWTAPGTLRAWGLFTVGAFTMTLALSYPELDTRQSWRPFFDTVASTLDEDRELWTTFIDDRKLPAIIYYLDRRVRLLRPPLTVPELLSRSVPVGIIVSAEQYATLEAELCAIPHRVIRAESGRTDLFVYVENLSAEQLLSRRAQERCGVDAAHQVRS